MSKRIKAEKIEEYFNYLARVLGCSVEQLITDEERKLAKEQGYLDIDIY